MPSGRSEKFRERELFDTFVISVATFFVSILQQEKATTVFCIYRRKRGKGLIRAHTHTHKREKLIITPNPDVNLVKLIFLQKKKRRKQRDF